MLFRYIAVLIAVLLCVPGLAQAQQRLLPQSPEQITLSFAPLVKQTAPAVVNIFTKQIQKVDLSPLARDPLFRLFMDQLGVPENLSRERVVQSLGSGVIVRSDGYVVTNYHVIKNSDQIRVVLNDRREFDAAIVTTDEKADLALLKLKEVNQPLPFMTMGDSDTLEVGDLVLAIGNPFGIGQTVTHGIVSALARTGVAATDYQFFIQTDAAINPGNSGGALVDMQGNLVGINTAIFSKTGASNGVGFATPVDIVRAIVASAENPGHIVRPWLGTSVQPVTAQIAGSLGLDRPQGVLVTKVVPRSPAAKAGLQVGDVIFTVDNHPIESGEALRYRVITYPSGETAELNILREGKRQPLRVILEPPPFNPKPDERTLKGVHPLSGATIANLSPGLSYQLDIEPQGGVVVTKITSGSVAARIGLEPGDILRSVNGMEIESADQAASLLSKRPNRWLIHVLRNGEVLEINLPG